MMQENHLALLQCPTCHEAPLVYNASDAILSCAQCQSRYPIIDGIPDLTPRFVSPTPPQPYQSERLSDLIAGAYDMALPLMSGALWGCSALRFVDWAHMCVGRAKGGVHLAFPVDTGKLYAHIWGPHLRDVQLVAADTSWNMLRRARRKFLRAGIPSPLLVRVDPAHLPFRADAFRSILSLNGLHHFPQRDAAWAELHRIAAPAGLLAGSTLVREPHRLLSKLFSLYDRAGYAPQPRSKEFVLSEIEDLGERAWFFETYGAVLFFGVEIGQPKANTK